ncbi:MAG: TenA family protein [Brevibacterium yomogidense]|uniref:TenA family protein n=1 Tax=Brevibacterium sp. Mu109 TaxID=1255669 RepID=UPI000C78AB5A|nr:TenA family protein [Brevibacterium sp. Mu109]
MMRTYEQGEHSSAVWAGVSGTLEKIEALDFLDRLAAGDLDAQSFVNYIHQDGLYLNGYAKAMSLLAAKAPTAEEARFWNRSAADAVEAETVMHADLLSDDRFAKVSEEIAPGGVAEPSPTTLGYVSYLVATAATEPYEAGVAAVLPCFWVYAHMGKVLVERAGDLTANPYAAWVQAYDSPDFDSAVDDAVTLYERCAAGTTEDGRGRMADAFAQATVYELHFWATSAAFQDWSV